MDIAEKQKEGYITLKEASALSGYSSDYLGQLIRQGKLDGKQVYANVAWMTTREAVLSYIAQSDGRPKLSNNEDPPQGITDHFALYAERIPEWVLRVSLSLCVAVLITFLLFEFFLAAVFIDRTLSRQEEPFAAAAEEAARNLVAHPDHDAAL